MSYDSTGENASLIAAGTALADPTTAHGGTPFVVVPSGYHTHDLEHLLPTPARKRAHVDLLDRVSFSQYVLRHIGLSSTVLYANVDYAKSHCAIKAVLDDHTADGPLWREHEANFVPALSHEWLTWTKADRTEFSQSKFAAFIEDNLADIATVDGMPTAAQMLGMALQFEMTSDKKFKKKVDLQAGGVTLEFVDQADAETTTKMALFQRFTVGIPVFDGSTDAYPIEARLKYRQRDTGLVFWFELVRPDRVFRTAVTGEFDAISEAVGLPILRGRPNLR